jgi:hypothetical protein
MMRTAALVVVLACCALAGCTGSTTITVTPTPLTATARPSPRPAPVARCAWYSPTTGGGQQVIVRATGPACGDPPVIDWIASITRRTWITTGYEPAATCIAQLARAGAIVQVWQTGFAPRTDQVAGLIADTLEGDGWRVEVPPGGPGPTPPRLPTPIGA